MAHLKVFNYLEDVYDVLFMDLRDADIREIKDYSGDTPQEALAKIISFHDSMFLIKDEYERTLGIYGTSPREDEELQGEIFFLATDDLFKENKYQVLKYSKDIVRDLMEMGEYQVLCNYVSSENTGSIKWLKWIGFEVYENKEVFFENPKVPFYFFKLERR